MRILKYTTDFAKRQGEPLNWFEIDLYDITDEVLKKVIPFALSHGKPFVFSNGLEAEKPTPGKWCSWVEFVARREQLPMIFISHWWGGCFRDFMAAIDVLVKDRALSVDATIWICTFANNQFGELFGASLFECPFLRAIDQPSVECVVHIVDRYCGSLLRTWCGLELHYATKQEKELCLYTSCGLVGSSSSGPLVEAIRKWDIRKSEASEESARRQILNYIAREPETQGLQVDHAGALVTRHGRTLFDEDSRDLDSNVKRVGGVHGREYKHEASLFAKRSEEFETLNMEVRLQVMAAVGKRRKAKGCKIMRSEERGITLEQWRTFAKKAEHSATSWKCFVGPGQDTVIEKCWAQLTTLDVHKNIIVSELEALGESDAAYVELMCDGPQRPHYVVSHLWLNRFSDLVRTIDLFAEANGLVADTVFWIDIVCEKSRDTAASLGRLPLPEDEGRRVSVIQNCRGMLLCSSGVWVSRLWQSWDCEWAGRLGLDLYFGSPSGLLACSSPFIDGRWIFGNFDVSLARSVISTTVEEGRASNQDQEIMLRAFFQERGKDGCQRLTAQFHRCVAGPVLFDAVMSGDVEGIRDILRIRGLSPNSNSMRGAMGETCLHLAAATGSLAVLRLLLDIRMDPNSEDGIRERPLHYASFVGNADAASLLLQHGADLHAESSFRETALEVAEQCPAAFLGSRTDRVAALLKDQSNRNAGI